MGKNHRNRSWRAQWTLDPISQTAVHKSGLTARVQPSPTNPDNDRIIFQGLSEIDHDRWDSGQLIEQATNLWMQGEF